MEKTFWDGFLKSLGFEPKKIKALQGASGIKHKILALGVDEEKKRIVIVQDEQDARVLSMAQVDIQATLKEYNVLMIRPVAINLSMAFGSIALLLGTSKLTQFEVEALSKKGETEAIVEENKSKLENIINSFSPQIEIIQRTKPNLVSVFKELVQQLSHVKFIGDLEKQVPYTLDFNELLNFNPIIYDTSLGICPIPLYDFSMDEAESLIKAADKDFNIATLKKHSIHQYFYPPSDSLALGLVENEDYNSKDLIKQIRKVPDIGHPFGKNELVDVKNIKDMVHALKENGLVAEGEISLTITEEGKEKRMQVKFSPRESIFKRLSNIFSVKVDMSLKDILGK